MLQSDLTSLYQADSFSSSRLLGLCVMSVIIAAHLHLPHTDAHLLLPQNLHCSFIHNAVNCSHHCVMEHRNLLLLYHCVWHLLSIPFLFPTPSFTVCSYSNYKLRCIKRTCDISPSVSGLFHLMISSSTHFAANSNIPFLCDSVKCLHALIH